jgi:hypothetical protein
MFTAVLRKRLLALNPRIVIMEVSCKTGSGIEGWINWLTREVEAFKGLKESSFFDNYYILEFHHSLFSFISYNYNLVNSHTTDSYCFTT